MNEDSTYRPNEELILKYLSGNVSTSEIAELEAWVAADAEHRAQFMELRKVWMLGAMADGSEAIDIDAAWEHVDKTISAAEGTRVVPMRSSRIVWRIAAAVLFLIVAGTVLYLQLNPRDQQYFAQDTRQVISLEDGSTVTLNRYAELIWVRDKSGRRTVALKGDAFFEVAKDPEHPFVIHTEELEVEVLGTSFYVDARTNQPTVDVTVETGRVAVRNGTNEVILSPEEKAIFNKALSTLEKQQNTDPNFVSVKTKTLYFKNSKLDEVARALNRQYQARVRVEQSVLASCALTATFEDKSLEAILQIIASTMDIEIVRQNHDIILRGSCTLN